MTLLAPPRITSFLVKIASRCNLACDYCYVYEHADQSWRSQPALMSQATTELLASRIGEYVREVNLDKLLIVFHGGEPMLAGAERIIHTATAIRSAVPPTTTVDAAVQTNGTLLKESDLRLFQEHHIGVSVSIDGDITANDLHRLDHAGLSTFDATMNGIRILREFPDIYTGLICVVDPRNEPRRLLSFFADLDPPILDFLLPDANYLVPPPGRECEPSRYLDWLIVAFDEWFENYPDMRIRSFDSLLEAIAGLPSHTDAFGLGDISLLSIETDGSYHDLDVLKIAKPGATSLNRHLADSSISETLTSSKLAAHRELLSFEGLSDECQRCPEVSVCGGGSVPHRFAHDGYRHPTVYCSEMLGLIHHARSRVADELSRSLMKSANDSPVSLEIVEGFDDSVLGQGVLKELHEAEAENRRRRFTALLHSLCDAGIPQAKDVLSRYLSASVERQREVAIQPSVVCWSEMTNNFINGTIPKSIDGEPLSRFDGYLANIASWVDNGLPPAPRIHRTDSMLRVPFGNKISFEPATATGEYSALVQQTVSLIDDWRPAIWAEMTLVSPEIQFIIDPTADPDKAVSFSDNAVPGALYVSLRQSGRIITPYDLADSLIHEHRHQRLYLLQSLAPIVSIDTPFVPSPWRAEPRPPTGLFHAVYVFCGLLAWWRHVSVTTCGDTQRYANNEIVRVMDKLTEGISTLRGTRLTAVGETLLDSLEMQIARVG